MGFREMRGGDGVSDVEIRRNEIIELLYTYLQMRFTVEPKDTQLLFQKKFTAKLPASEATKP